MRRVLVAALALVAVAGIASMPEASGVVSTPTLSDPPPGAHGYPLWDSYYDLAPFGYQEREFFVSGTAQDAAGTPAPYTTRIIVTRPSDAAKFNGTVLLDWVNVTAQFENAVDTMLAREMLMREGFAYVHVSAQKVGVDGPGLPLLTPKTWDLARYLALSHPGDEWSFDMFTQIARSFEAPGAVDPMGGLSVQRILAAGQSQSANRLAEYVESWLPTHPDAVGVIDGILVHGNVPGEKAFAAASPVPVLQLLSDYEAVDDGIDPASLGANHRLWEIAGASHADYFIGYQSEFGHGPRVLGAPKVSEPGFRDIIRAAGNYGEVVSPLLAVCTAAGATMPMHYATSTAIHQLNDWVATGTAPASGPRFQFAGGGLAADEHGNTLGGIRLPPIDVPVARYVSTICQLGGITIPFSDAQIQGLYGTHANYYALMAEKSDAAVAAGWLLPEDAVDLMTRVCAASVRFGIGPVPCPAYAPVAFNRARALPAAAAPAPAAAPAGAGRLPDTGGAPGVVLPMALVAAALAARRMRNVAA